MMEERGDILSWSRAIGEVAIDLLILKICYGAPGVLTGEALCCLSMTDCGDFKLLG